MWVDLIIAYHLTSRLAYVLWVGIALTRQQHRSPSDADRVETEFERFRRQASRLMMNDAASFVLLCLVTRQSLVTTIPRGLTLGLGGVLVVVGIATKVWAANTLGRKAYYWHNFFATDPSPRRDAAGPYRYLKNPMYTVGYLQCYGLALALGSLPALLAALFDQAAILTFHHLVEKPHYQALVLTGESFVPASRPAAP
jgi:protein-S-isoprenylcysteine O-methyltransferase Ste14